MSLMSSLSRLERAGDHGSKTNAKILAAAKEVSDKIISILLPPFANSDEWVQNGAWSSLLLPLNYAIQIRGMSGTVPYQLVVGEKWNEDAVDVSIAAARRFAEDLTDGLLEEIAMWLQEENEDREAAHFTLKTASRALGQST